MLLCAPLLVTSRLQPWRLFLRLRPLRLQTLLGLTGQRWPGCKAFQAMSTQLVGSLPQKHSACLDHENYPLWTPFPCMGCRIAGV